MVSSKLSKFAIALAACLALAGCKTDAERAADYFQSGMERLEAGDTDRAIVEFRNVFQFEANHYEARMAMGNILLERDNPRAAYAQILRAAEQHPDAFEARRILSELAFVAGDWDEFMRHGAVSVEMMPEDERVKAINLGMKYREAVIGEDDPARDALTVQAEELLASLPESDILNELLVDSYLRDGRLSETLARMDVMIAQNPDNRRQQVRRLAILGQMQDMTGIEAQLAEMVERFPGDQEIQGMLFRYYVSQQRLDDAEAFLREISDPADEDPALFLSLIQFVEEIKGVDAARVEIQRAVDLSPKPNRFKAMLALLDFQAGERENAIASMEAMLADENTDQDEMHTIKTNLARMLVGTGNEVGARRHVEEVLAQNSTNVDALKMQAAWQLQADQVDEAIANLRVALDMAPEDVQIMNLMNQAYTRLGDTNLARDFLARAVEASGNAPAPSLRYARQLMQEERYLPAEDVLLPALQQAPRNIDLLTLLGQLYLEMEDSARATQVIDTLNRIDSEPATGAANSLQADLLSRQSGTSEALAFLENLAQDQDAGLREKLMLFRARLQIGETKEALEMAEALVLENPDNLGLKNALATTRLAAGDLEGAEAMLREVTDAAPKEATSSWLQRVRIASRQGDNDKARNLIDEALEATDRNGNVLWVKASLLERERDIDGAIAIYEELYERNSNSVIVANNLASLLATYKDDAESLERAWVVGRRLRDAENPALQDTYGWILFRRGDVADSVTYLENAAAQLNDPIVQAHLGFAYAALERNEEALVQMQKAVDLAGPADTRERIEAARAEITRLRNLPEN